MSKTSNDFTTQTNELAGPLVTMPLIYQPQKDYLYSMLRSLFILLFILGTHARSADKPNILWLTIEDTSPHFIGCYGDEAAKTPNIDAIANEGIRFNRAFANAPVCSSARSAIITGAVNGKLGTGNHRSAYPLPEEIKGFPTYLRAKGYYTSNNVKTDYATSSERRIVKESWDECSARAGWRKRAGTQPFFSVFNFDHSHQSRTMTWSYEWYRKNIFEPLSPSEQVREASFEVPPFYPDTPKIRKHFARIYNSLSYTDREIGKVLQRLKKDKLYDDTIIFIYADHGEAMPRGKSTATGLGYRVPFIIRFPEKWQHLNPWGKNGTTTEELICFDDLAPTMLSLIGEKPAPWMTGRPILGELREPPRPFVFGSRNRIDENIGCARSITDGRYLYTRNFQPGPGLPYIKYFEVGDISRVLRKDQKRLGQSVLFAPQVHDTLHDLKADPWEMTNLIQDPKHTERVNSMRTTLFADIIQTGDVLLLPEYEIAEISKKSTPFEFGQSMSLVDRKTILEAADLSSLPTVHPKIIETLKSGQPVPQYWAASAFRLNPRYPRHLFKLSDIEYPPAKIEFATALFNYDQDEEAFDYLSQCLLSKNAHMQLQAAQRIQELGEVGRPFLPALKKASKSRSGNTRSSVLVTRFLLGGPDISYPDPR